MCDKIKYESSEKAKEALDNYANKKGHKSYSGPMASYYCSMCDAWHLRSRRKRLKHSLQRSTFNFTPPPQRGVLHIRDLTFKQAK